jgi:hypothetical protein
MMRQGKPGKPTELGRCGWLEEVEGGLISRYVGLDGRGNDKAPWPPRLDHHSHPFGPPPALLTGDRGRHSTAHERSAPQHGVGEGGLPKPGQKSAQRSAYEQQDWLRAGRNWRAGIEGRSRALQRRPKRDRCCSQGAVGRARGVGRGVIAYDLHVIARHLTA